MPMLIRILTKMRWMLLSIVWFMVIQSRSRAQTNDLFRFDANYPGARSLFPSVMFNNNIKDLLVDEGSVQRVITILQSNIKQWSFVESQLLEPNVNLGMPEIFIPLRHLTTTLEVLGNILYMRNDIVEAKNSLERACPLMELLPPAANEDGQRYAVGCFALLREVYGKLYNIGDGNAKLRIGMGDDASSDAAAAATTTAAAQPSTSTDAGVSAVGEAKPGRTEHDVGTDSSDTSYHDKDNDEDNNDDDSHNSAISRPKGRRRRKRFNSIISSSGSGGKRTSSRFPADTPSSRSGESSTADDDDSTKDDLTGAPFDVDQRFEDLRSPYEHLRAEVLAQHRDQPLDQQLAIQQQREQQRKQPPLELLYREGAGLATTTADLDALVQRFVFEDEAGRLKLFRMAKDYYEAMTKHMATNPQLINGLGRDLDIVLAYVEVLAQVNEDGFDFISSEIDDFLRMLEDASDGDHDHEADSDSDYPAGDYSDYDDAADDLNSIADGLAKKSKDPLSRAEQNRLMVLHAFDRALSGEFLPADTDADADVDSIGLGKQRTAWGRLAAGSKQQHDSRNTMYDYEPEGDGHDTIFDDSGWLPPFKSLLAARGDSIASLVMFTFLCGLFGLIIAAAYQETRKRNRVHSSSAANGSRSRTAARTGRSGAVEAADKEANFFSELAAVLSSIWLELSHSVSQNPKPSVQQANVGSTGKVSKNGHGKTKSSQGASSASGAAAAGSSSAGASNGSAAHQSRNKHSSAAKASKHAAKSAPPPQPKVVATVAASERMASRADDSSDSSESSDSDSDAHGQDSSNADDLAKLAYVQQLRGSIVETESHGGGSASSQPFIKLMPKGRGRAKKGAQLPPDESLPRQETTDEASAHVPASVAIPVPVAASAPGPTDKQRAVAQRSQDVPAMKPKLVAPALGTGAAGTAVAGAAAVLGSQQQANAGQSVQAVQAVAVAKGLVPAVAAAAVVAGGRAPVPSASTPNAKSQTASHSNPPYQQQPQHSGGVASQKTLSPQQPTRPTASNPATSPSDAVNATAAAAAANPATNAGVNAASSSATYASVLSVQPGHVVAAPAPAPQAPPTPAAPRSVPHTQTAPAATSLQSAPAAMLSSPGGKDPAVVAKPQKGAAVKLAVQKQPRKQQGQQEPSSAASLPVVAAASDGFQLPTEPSGALSRTVSVESRSADPLAQAQPQPQPQSQLGAVSGDTEPLRVLSSIGNFRDDSGASPSAGSPRGMDVLGPVSASVPVTASDGGVDMNGLPLDLGMDMGMGMGGIDLSFAVSPNHESVDDLVGFQLGSLLLEDTDDVDQAQQRQQQHNAGTGSSNINIAMPLSMSEGQQQQHQLHSYQQHQQQQQQHQHQQQQYQQYQYQHQHQHQQLRYDFGQSSTGGHGHGHTHLGMQMPMMEYPRLQFPPDSHFAQSGLSPNAPTFNPGPAMALVGMMAPASYDYAPYGVQLGGGLHSSSVDASGAGHQHQLQHQHQHQHQQDMYGSSDNNMHLAGHQQQQHQQQYQQQYFLQSESPMSPMVGMNVNASVNTAVGGSFVDAAAGSTSAPGSAQMVYSTQPHAQVLQQPQQPQQQMQSIGAGGSMFYSATNGHGQQQTASAPLAAGSGVVGAGFSNGSGSSNNMISNSNGFAMTSSFQQFATTPSPSAQGSSLDNSNKPPGEMNSEPF